MAVSTDVYIIAGVKINCLSGGGKGVVFDSYAIRGSCPVGININSRFREISKGIVSY